MTDEQKWIVDSLRAYACADCMYIPNMCPLRCKNRYCKDVLHQAADLIESLIGTNAEERMAT